MKQCKNCELWYDWCRNRGIDVNMIACSSFLELKKDAFSHWIVWVAFGFATTVLSVMFLYFISIGGK